LQWTYKVSGKRFVDYAQPILMKPTSKNSLNPRRIIEGFVGKILSNKSLTHENLFVSLFNIWIDPNTW
jgi:hypothetical protein